MRYYVYILALASLIILPCCTSRNGNSSENRSTETDSDTAPASELPLPKVPATLTDPAARASFIADHFWDKMEWDNPRYTSSEAFMGQNMANYISVLKICSDDDLRKILKRQTDRLPEGEKGDSAFSETAYSYLYHPESPQYDPELYLRFIDAWLARPTLAEPRRQLLESRRDEILKNRVGSLATDFSYIGEDGSTHRLLATAPNAEIRFLMLYDPECEVCKSAVAIISSSQSFSESVLRGETAVIAINAFGQEGGGKAQRPDNFPPSWITGYSPDARIDADETYVIRATPAIYIIDAKGIILEKDVSIERLRQIVA